MLDLQEWIYLSRHESVKIQQYVGIKFGKDIANMIKHSKMETENKLMLITGHSTLEALQKYLRDIDAELPEDYSEML